MGEIQEIKAIEELFTLEEIIGEGKFGVVHSATDRDGREVAVKVIDPQRWERLKDLEYASREVDNWEQVSGSPYFPKYHGAYQAEGKLYIVTERIKGKTLREVLNERIKRGEGGYSPEEAKEIILEVAQALKSIHGNDGLHRDLSSNNVMVTDEGEIKLIDIGAMKGLDELDTNTTALVTPGYAAPETMMENIFSIRSDIYALGALGAELVTGKQPTKLVKEGKIQTDIFSKLVEPSRHLRPKSVDEVVEILENPPVEKYELTVKENPLVKFNSQAARLYPLSIAYCILGIAIIPLHPATAVTGISVALMSAIGTGIGSSNKKTRKQYLSNQHLLQGLKVSSREEFDKATANVTKKTRRALLLKYIVDNKIDADHLPALIGADLEMATEVGRYAYSKGDDRAVRVIQIVYRPTEDRVKDVGARVKTFYDDLSDEEMDKIIDGKKKFAKDAICVAATQGDQRRVDYLKEKYGVKLSKYYKQKLTKKRIEIADVEELDYFFERHKKKGIRNEIADRYHQLGQHETAESIYLQTKNREGLIKLLDFHAEHNPQACERVRSYLSEDLTKLVNSKQPTIANLE